MRSTQGTKRTFNVLLFLISKGTAKRHQSNDAAVGVVRFYGGYRVFIRTQTLTRDAAMRGIIDGYEGRTTGIYYYISASLILIPSMCFTFL